MLGAGPNCHTRRPRTVTCIEVGYVALQLLELGVAGAQMGRNGVHMPWLRPRPALAIVWIELLHYIEVRRMMHRGCVRWFTGATGVVVEAVRSGRDGAGCPDRSGGTRRLGAARECGMDGSSGEEYCCRKCGSNSVAGALVLALRPWMKRGCSVASGRNRGRARIELVYYSWYVPLS